MCHKQPDCMTCHEQKGIKWQPKNGWDYDPGVSDGPSPAATPATATRHSCRRPSAAATSPSRSPASSDSAHCEITCQQCHPDYRYDDKPGPTKLWNVNAGIQCGTCHQDAEDERTRAPVALYEKSIHAQQIRDGNYDSATCASCHGGHFIQRLEAPPRRAQRMHGAAYRICARCKQHGQVRDLQRLLSRPRVQEGRAGCSCVLAVPRVARHPATKNDPSRASTPANLGATCGQPGCHKGSNEKFADSGRGS